ncbi:extracellular solute-binding protein [Conexibacter sp. SYSU D00693]|uniref:extracellular solute-binding protein n=1 Tax=Conexibacter sp. SYSU D00693 TaxID=2812560 RepID=UPI00196A9FA4|nr:extracellular solute-binding protein [Conexibacter sp. SYSU D00693]
MRRVIAAALTASALALGAAACGDDSSSSGQQKLTWFIATQPGGSLEKIAKRCSDASDGRYRISIELLPTQADAQREQLVRRLGAEDSSIDLVGMDVVWTGEFANAGWVQEVPRERREALTRNVFRSILRSAQFEDRLYAAPIWSNTQLLWYRKDLVKEPPRTWDEMLDEAERLGAKGKVQVQAKRYEGLVVWANAMIASAGTAILTGPEQVGLEPRATERALALMGRLGRSSAAAPDIGTSNEDSARMGFESGSSAFMINYPFVFPSAKANAPDVFKEMGAAKYPAVDADRPSAPPLGGFNIGVSKFSKHSDLAWDAVECLVSKRNQLEVTELEGLPPVREDLFDEPAIRKAYPGFADVIRDSIADASPRPSESPAYQDLSLAVQRALHPVSDIDPRDPKAAYDRLKDKVEQAVKREGLL